MVTWPSDLATLTTKNREINQQIFYIFLYLYIHIEIEVVRFGFAGVKTNRIYSE